MSIINLRRARQGVFCGGAVLLALAVAGCSRPGASPPASGPGPSAKVVLEAYYPFNESHQFIADYLQSLPEKYGPDVVVELIDMETDEGHARWEKTGLSCGGVFVNGKTSATITEEGQTREVKFLSRMDVQWQRRDLEKVIEQELRRTGGGDS